MRSLYVEMDEVLDALDTRNPEIQFFLDVETGKVELQFDGWDSRNEEGGETPPPADNDRYARIPTRDARTDLSLMRSFAAGLDESGVRSRLDRALDGKGALTRFRDAI